MMWVLIFSVILVTVQSYTMEDLRVVSAIPRVNNMALFPMIKNINDIYEPMVIKYKNELSQINFEANTIMEFLNKYNKSFNTLEKIITDTLYDDIVKELWTYCFLALNEMKLYSEKQKLTEEDFNVISFIGTHHYDLIYYLHHFKYNIGVILHATLYLQSLKYIKFDTDVVSEITKQLTYFKDNIKLINGNSPQTITEDILSKYNSEEKKKFLRNIETSILNTNTIFKYLNLPKFIISNLVLQPDPIKKTTKESIEHLLKMEIIDITYEKDPSQSNSQTNVITKWDTTSVINSSKYKHEEYMKSVMHRDEYEKYREKMDKENLANMTSINSKIGSEKINLTKNTLYTLIESFAEHNNYINVLEYNNIAADVLLARSMKNGFMIISGIKSLIADVCSSTPKMILNVTAHHINVIRAQLLQFNYLYIEFKEFLLFIIPEVFMSGSVSDEALFNKIIELSSLLSIPKDMNIDTFKINNCSLLNSSLTDIPSADLGQYNHLKFMNYYFYNPVLNTFMLFDYAKDMYRN